MKTLLLGFVGGIAILSGAYSLAQQAPASPAALKVSIVVPEIFYPERQEDSSARRLTN